MPTCFNDTDNQNLAKKCIHALFIDFSKAFDLVDHSLLLTKHKHMKINKNLSTWIQSSLSERTQQVKVPGILSSIKNTVLPGYHSSSTTVLFNISIQDFESVM